jgi:hypothetical protein
MRFDQREWISDIAVSTVAGFLCGATGAILFARPPYAVPILAGGTIGLVNGLALHPLRWLLELRPDRKRETRRDSNESSNV